MFLTNVDQLRQIEWGKTYLWDLKFPDAPTPFSEWFPATDVEENLLTLTGHTFEAFLSTYSVPKSTTEFDLKITFVDDINHTLSSWFTDWVNSGILNGGSHISTLEESVKIVYLAKLNLDKSPIKFSSYLVYPEGELYFVGNSESNLPTYNIELKIAGSVKTTNKPH